MVEKTEYTYEEVEAFLKNPENPETLFEEPTKFVHVCMAYTGNIRWAWGSQSYYKDKSCFSEKQQAFMQNATFKKLSHLIG